MGALISYPDRTLAANLSGGAWQPTAPLSNLKDDILSHVARTTNALANSSIILIDLGSVLEIRVASLCKHNISLTGTVRVRGYSDNSYTDIMATVDTGVISAWPDGLTAQNVADYPHNWTYAFATPAAARYWKVEIIDTTNPAGYLELGRCWLGEAAFEPEVGISNGSSLGYESRDVIVESLGGAIYGDKRIPRRVQVATFSFLSPVEKRKALIMQKVLTTTDEAFWIENTDSIAEDMLLESFPCYFRKASPLTYPYLNNNEMPIEVVEKV